MSASVTPVDRALRVVEDVVYALIGTLLLVGALVLLVKAAYDLATGLDDGAQSAITEVLDPLLLVFILVELLGAVRETVRHRQLLAEPFLLVGLIASIKEIVIGTFEAKDHLGTDTFEDAMVRIAVLTALLLVLALAAYLMRRKEREPEESEVEVEPPA